MSDGPTIRNQILALPASAGADGRDLIDRAAVLAIIDAVKPGLGPKSGRDDVRDEREGCAAICDERAEFYRASEKAEAGDRERTARMHHTSTALGIAANMIRTRSGWPLRERATRVLFGKELNDDDPKEGG